MEKEKRDYFPLFVASKNKKVLVVGGGKIAERRVKTLLEFAFDITVVSTEITEDIKLLADSKDVALHKRAFEPSDIQNQYMVIAATNDRATNEYIGKACRAQNIYVSVADKKEECNFYFPAIVLDKETVTGITSEGKSHKAASEKAKKLRGEL